MKTKKLTFYEDFRCSAGDCPFTCCQQWKIAVDPETEGCWREKDMGSSVTSKDGGRVIALNEKGHCPYLNEEGLCSLVIAHGEEMIPQTCRIFPRQVHRFSDRTEYSMVACCPEVVDWLKKVPRVLEPEMLSWPAAKAASERADFLQVLRDWMIFEVQNPERSVESSLKLLFYALLDLYDKGTETVEACEACADFMPKLEEAMNQIPTDREASLSEINELFLDICENYRREGLYREALEPAAALAELWEGLLKEKGELAEKLLKTKASFDSHMRIYQPFFRNWLACELFANSLLPETGLPDLLMMVQWIAMEYALIRHGLFLERARTGQLNWSQMRDWVVLISRMTGYEQEDIYAYLEQSFQEPVWEWGYLALLLPE